MKKYLLLFCAIFILNNISIFGQNFSTATFKTLSDYSNYIYNVSFSPTGNYFALTVRDGTVEIYDKNFVKYWTQKRFHNVGAGSVEFSPDGKLLAISKYNSGYDIAILDIQNKQIIQKLTGHGSYVDEMTFTPDGEFLISASSDEELIVWQKTGNNFREYQTLKSRNSKFYSVEISPNGEYLAAGSYKEIIVWKLSGSRFEEYKVIPAHNNTISNLSFSSDGKYFVSGSYDKTVMVWNIENGEFSRIKTLSGHSGSVYSVAFSPDGKFIASASDDSSIKIWKNNNGRFSEIRTISDHSAAVRCLAFSDNGLYLASGSKDNSCIIREITGIEIVENNNNQNTNNNNRNTNNEEFDEISEVDFIESLPPILSIEDISFSENILNAEEDAILTITIKNSGPGDAKNVYIELSTITTVEGLIFPKKINVPSIQKNGGTQEVEINFRGSINLANAEASLKIEVFEPVFSVKVPGKQLTFKCKEFQKPNLLLAQFAVLENQSSSPNNMIDLNEIIDVKFAIQNIGAGEAEKVKVEVTNYQEGVVLLGVVNGEQLTRKHPEYELIKSGKYENVIYRYFVNSEFTDGQLEFSVDVDESRNEYGFSETKLVAINTELEPEGYIRIVDYDEEIEEDIEIENVPDFVVDVDNNIPNTEVDGSNTLAIIIGIEKYKYAPTVDYAKNDAQVFNQYAQTVLGVPEQNIYYRVNEDATSGEFNKIFVENGWIARRVKQDVTNVIVYYAGHGAPDVETGKAFFIPYDIDPNYAASTGFTLERMYESLEMMNAKSVTVFIDACFSGSGRNEDPLIAGVRAGIRIKVDDTENYENLAIFSAASESQFSTFYPEKNHGLFTYFLLKGLRGEAKGNDNNLTIQELFDYIKENVSYQAGFLDKEQTPSFNGEDTDRVIIEY
jgi:hypothetical protein